MSTAAALPLTHPWLDRFDAEPAAALADLMAGQAYLPGLQRATPCQALEVLFGDLDRQDAADRWDLLDRTLLAWLQGLRQQADGLIERPGGVRRFITEAGEGYRAIHRLDLPSCAAWLASAWVTEIAWAERFVENSAFDLVNAILGAAAHVQTDDKFRFVWMRFCEHAANRRLRHRIDATLLGVASMPASGLEVMPRQELLTGLVRWGGAMDGNGDHRAQSQFVRRVRQVKSAFPHTRDFWLDRWGAVLASDKTAPHVRDWLCSLWPELAQGRGVAEFVPRLSPSVKGDVEKLGQRWDKARSPALLAESEEYLARLEKYAVATGDSHFLVMSASNLGKTVRNGAPGHVLRWMRRSLLWMPSHEQSWGLRADCLARLGRTAEAEAVLWEAGRRFPHHAPHRQQLALLLVARGADRLAERVLQESLLHDPDHGHSEVVLARLLWRTGRPDEAAGHLNRFLDRLHARGGKDPIALYTLGLILLAEGRRDQAMVVRDQYVARYGDNSWAQTLTRLLEGGAAGRAEAQAVLSEPYVPAQTSSALDAQAAPAVLAREAAEAPFLARAAWGTQADTCFRLGETANAVDLAGQALRIDGDDVLANVVMALGQDEFRHDLRRRLHRFTGLLPVHLAALADRGSADDDWQQVRDTFTDPDERGLIALVQVGLAGGSPGEDLERWLRKPTERGDEGGLFLKTQVRACLSGRAARLDLSTLAHDALLREVPTFGTVPEQAA